MAQAGQNIDRSGELADGPDATLLYNFKDVNPLTAPSSLGRFSDLLGACHHHHPARPSFRPLTPDEKPPTILLHFEHEKATIVALLIEY